MEHHFHTFVFVLIILSMLNISSIDCAKKKKNNQCSKDSKERFDADVARLLSVGRYGRHFPENVAEHQTYCADTHLLNERLDVYKSTCSHGTSKEFTSVILFSIRRATKLNCRRSPSLKKRYEKLYAMCACNNKLNNQTGTCMENYIDSLLSIKKLPVIKKQVPYSCCEYYKFLKCLDDAFNLLPECVQESETLQEFIRSIFDDIINVACGEYVENSDKCERLPKLPEYNITLIKRPKSALIPLIEIWDQLS